MGGERRVPALGIVRVAYGRLWDHRALHAKAIWAPVVFLVTAEFLYHRMVGNADGMSARWHAVLAAPWYMPAGALLAWLAGLKFLLSFSISWRRHLLLGERFDPFFFKAPFWRYLGFLLLTYAWILGVLLVAAIGAGAALAVHVGVAGAAAAILIAAGAGWFIVWGIARQMPFFTVLALGSPEPGWRGCTGAMRGQAGRYVAAFVVAMLPVVALDLALDLGLSLAGADRHSVPVALGESAFRQAMLFVHFSLGATIGAAMTLDVLPGLRARLPGAALRDPLS